MALVILCNRDKSVLVNGLLAEALPNRDLALRRLLHKIDMLQ